jgi:hypothetical protein
MIYQKVKDQRDRNRVAGEQGAISKSVIGNFFFLLFVVSFPALPSLCTGDYSTSSKA